MEEKNLTAEQSLEIIRESIERSQRTMAKKSALPMLWWGGCVIILALVISYFWKNHGGYMNFLWILIWPLGYVGEWLIGKKQEAIPTPFVGKVIGQVWGTLGICCGGIGILLGLIGGGFLPMKWIEPSVFVLGSITSLFSLCFGISTTITGSVIQNRLIQICGFLAGIGGFFGALHFLDYRQMYVMAGVAFIGLVLPGVIIYLQNKN